MMNSTAPNIILDSPQPPVPAPTIAEGTAETGRLERLVGHAFSLALSLVLMAALVGLGQHVNWSLPKASALRGETRSTLDDWCKEHCVPKSICVECRRAGLTGEKGYKACREHGVADCPLCHPDVAQTPSMPEISDEDRARAARSLAFSSRVENDAKCKIHHRQIQLASQEVADRLGIVTALVTLGPVTESVRAPGDIEYDPTRVARLAPRVPGTVFGIHCKIGDRVRIGDVLALVETADVGRAKADFQLALTQLGLRTQSLERLRLLAETSASPLEIQEAEFAREEARLRLLTAEQALANLGLPIRAAELGSLAPAELARRLQFLGLPDRLTQGVSSRTPSSNLLPITAPFDGEVVALAAAAGDLADPAKPLFVVADTSRMRLTLRARLEDADRLRPGQLVRFRHAGHAGPLGWDTGSIAWVSLAADERTRFVPVRVNLPNPSDRHHANTFGTGEVILRSEPAAVVVPSSAVHWEGCCHIVFVRDRDFEKPDAAKVYHVRKVRPGARDLTVAGPVTEIAAGLLPGEWVATTNSGILRSELLKNNLGAG